MRSIPRPSTRETGQVMPLCLVVLTLIFLLFYSMSHSILSSHKSLVGSEEAFQKRFTHAMRVAYRLNRIASNNNLMLQSLGSLVRIYLVGTGTAMDLAATTPLWEKSLPIPTPESVFAPFDTALQPVTQMLARLTFENSQLVAELPELVRMRILQSSMQETLCSLNVSKKQSIPNLRPQKGCALQLDMSLLASPHLRHIRDTNHLLGRLQVRQGVALIQISQDLLLNNSQLNFDHNQRSGPFRATRILLTHGQFCSTQARIDLRGHCPKAINASSRSTSSWKSSGADPVSFQPHWSVSVEN